MLGAIYSEVLTRTLRPALALGCTLAALAATAPAAPTAAASVPGVVLAHTALEATAPKDGARVGAEPDQVVLDFTGPIRTRLSKVTVRGPEGQRFESGPAQVTTDKVTQPLRPLGAVGRYQVIYRVVARDGHPLAGTVRFTLTRPGSAATPAASAGAPEQAPAPQARAAAEESDRGDSGGIPPWMLVIGAFGALAVVTGAVWFGRRVTHDID
jgi:copper resistance protein C